MSQNGLGPSAGSLGERTGDGQLIKSVNRKRILEEISAAGSISRATIAKESGLNKATVSTQVAELIGAGLVLETGPGASELGRKPLLLKLDGDAGYSIGLGLSAGILRAVVRDFAGVDLSSRSTRVAESGPEAVAAAIMGALDETIVALPPSRYGVLGIGLAVPGVVDAGTERVLRSAHLDWESIDLKERLAGRYGCPIRVGNDANLAAMAELSPGGARDDAICILVDDGIGGGIFLGGKMYAGVGGRFGEVGHMTFIHGGRECSCGNRGCWDAYASERALLADLAAALGAGAPAGLAEAIALDRSGDARAAAVFETFADYLASGIVSLENLLAPSLVVVNSEVLSALPRLYARLEAKVAERAMAYNRDCVIRLSRLGKAAPAIGASIAASELFLEAAIDDLEGLAAKRR
jgi:predicted NBD/HSP70 family sugar kinase